MTSQNHTGLSLSPSLSLAHDPATTAETLAMLIGSGDPEVRAEAATHRHATPSMIETLANDPHYVVLAAVVTNPRVPAATLDRIAATLDRIAARVASAPDAGTPEEFSSRKNLREAVEFAIAQHRPKTLLGGVVQAATRKDVAPATAPVPREPKRVAQR